LWSGTGNTPSGQHAKQNTRQAESSMANALPISFANNVPAILHGNAAAVATHIHTDPVSGAVQLFADQARALSAYSGPLGLQAGPRNNLRGPRFSNLDLGVAKHFPVREKVTLSSGLTLTTCSIM
jgi:hypothetical protein